jgi:hypothetical protein
MKINLISKRRRGSSERNWTKIISYALFGSFSLYFLGVTLYVVISILSLNSKISSAQSESLSISQSMLSNNEKLSRFALTKLILTQIDSTNKTKFHYKEYLDQISSFLPRDSVLTGVDFKFKGWISLSVSSNNVYSFKALESILLNENTWKNSESFSGAYIEGVSKDKNGTYTTRLQLELKNNG